MLKSVATKIAHNSTIPSLAGNSDLRSLQDLITAEKSVLTSLQRLSVDVAKASEALRTWGLGEGDDLGDTLSASANILTHYSSALSQYASHGQRMRDQLKAIRTREEALDDLKRRRRSVMSSADSADKKLSKMSPENKNLMSQQETLNRLRNEIRSLDADIMAEESSLGDFKRSQVKTMMGLKFGGLLECSEKGIIAGEYGKVVIAEIPEEVTQPGVPRGLYYGHPRTEELVAQAHHRVSEVVLSTTIPVKDPQVSYPDQDQVRQGYDTRSWAQGDSSSTNGKYLSTPQGIANGRFLDNSPSMAFDAPQAPLQRPSNYELTDGPRKQSVDDFGIPAWGSSNAGASRFNTYPPKIGPSGDGEGSSKPHNEPPYLPTRQESTPFSAFTEALSTIVDQPRANANVRVSGGSIAPPSYVEPGLDAQYQEASRFLGQFCGIEEENDLLTYPGGAHEQQVSSHQGQTQNELPVATGHYRGYAEIEDADYANQPTGTQGDLPERVSQNYSASDMDSTPRNRTAFEIRNQQAPGSEEEERALNTAAAREIGREMEAMNITRDRSLPQSVHSTVTHDLNTNSPPPSDVPVPMTMVESTLPPPVAPFARQTISPRPSFERLQLTSSQPHTNQLYRSPLVQSRQLPPSYETPEFPLPTPAFPPSPQITTRSSFSSSRGSPDISSPVMSKVSSTGSLPPGGRTIPAAAFKRVIPRKGSEATIGDRGRLATASPSQSHLQSPVIPPPRERSNSDSRPLPTPPQHDRDSDYGAGRFVTNLEEEWK